MKLAITLILLALALIVGPAAWNLTHHAGDPVPARGLPWQIETLPSGESQVFDLTLGRSTLADARTHFGPEMQLAIVAEPNEAGNVEGYYESVTAGFVAGKLIVTASSSWADGMKASPRIGAASAAARSASARVALRVVLCMYSVLGARSRMPSMVAAGRSAVTISLPATKPAVTLS